MYILWRVRCICYWPVHREAFNPCRHVWPMVEQEHVSLYKHKMNKESIKILKTIYQKFIANTEKLPDNLKKGNCLKLTILTGNLWDCIILVKIFSFLLLYRKGVLLTHFLVEIQITLNEFMTKLNWNMFIFIQLVIKRAELWFHVLLTNNITVKCLSANVVVIGMGKTQKVQNVVRRVSDVFTSLSFQKMNC